MQGGIWNRAAALLLVATLAGCAPQNVNPVTGRQIYPVVPTATEAHYGQLLDKEIVAEYGVYRDPALTAYVNRVGQAVAKHAVRKDIRYSFTILDDEEVNAYALPGGYVYVTRGSLNFANSEAELAAVLGHEIGHIDAFHFRKDESDKLSAVLSVLLRHTSSSTEDLALAQRLADRSKKGSRYSQEQEFEADALGIHYMTLAGYDPQGMVNLLRGDQAKSALDENGTKGNPVARDIFAMGASHPSTPARLARAEAAAKKAVASPDAIPGGAAGLKTERAAYLAAIEGLTYGAVAEEGSVDGRRVVHPAFGFGFEAPEGFDLWSDRDGFLGVGRNAVLVVAAIDDNMNRPMAAQLQSMADGKTVENVRPLSLDIYRGVTGTVRLDPFVIRLGAIQDNDYNIYELTFIAPKAAFNDLDAGFVDAMRSFRPLKAGEAKSKPLAQIRIVTVAPGDTANTLADRMAVPDHKLEWFRVLNALEPDDTLEAGDTVKLVQ